MKKSILSKICLITVLTLGSLISHTGVIIANNNENSIFRLYLGVNTIWYLHNHFVCDKLLCLFA